MKSSPRYFSRIDAFTREAAASLVFAPAQRICSGTLPFVISLCNIGLMECSETVSQQNKSEIHTVKVIARFRPGFRLPHIGLSFILSTTDGRRYVLGTGQYPFVRCTYDDSAASEPSGQSCTQLTLEYSNIHGLLELR